MHRWLWTRRCSRPTGPSTPRSTRHSAPSGCASRSRSVRRFCSSATPKWWRVKWFWRDDGYMARARIPAGGSGTVTHQVRIDGRWLAESRVRADGIAIPRGVERRARLPYRTVDGVRGEITVGGPTRGACETAVRARLDDLRAQEAEAARPRARGTLRRYVEQWIALLEAGELPRRYSARSVDTYRSIARRHALPATIADTPVDDLTRADLKRALRAVPAPAQRHVLVLWRHAWD